MTEHPLTKFIPNLITLMSLIAGISSIKFSIQSNFKNNEDKLINSRLTVYEGKKVDKLDIKNEKQATDIYDQIQKSKPI